MKTATSPKPTTIEVKKMDFPEAIRQVIKGKSVTKLEWQNHEFYVNLEDGYLKLHKPDGKSYNLIVSDGDLMGEDWLLI